ncbi:flagellar basal body rod protein FlgB [Bacillus sp. B15-48]|uniref:flagellar basal body rod protein FlgB n=1 Tax=Bacillus sp. B15-48 TaxID=1548601 RepID=UPI00193FB92A|nr:flagellar basal body rod protein FlgB [Bacillus sp. B15-48]MBM4764134.1 flagellar basal body rod protein FlgB [Bacillus sp. B15-48]
MNQITNIMAQALDASAMRQKAISNNIANANTPNYQPKRVEFETVFQKELNSTFTGNQTNAKHLAIGKTNSTPTPQLIKENTLMRNNGNGVDMDYEMTEMSKNALWYSSLTYGINEEFNLLKMSIRGSR